MCDFNQLSEIFSIKNEKTQTPTGTPCRKRKLIMQSRDTKKRKQPANKCNTSFTLGVSTIKSPNESILNQTMSPMERVKNSEIKFNSPDKKQIVEHLSCDVEDFAQEPQEVINDSESDDDL